VEIQRNKENISKNKRKNYRSISRKYYLHHNTVKKILVEREIIRKKRKELQKQTKARKKTKNQIKQIKNRLIKTFE